MSGCKPLTCAYCGVPIRSGRACGLHRPLWDRDPAGGAAQGSTSERELGAVDQWPAGELEDDGTSE